MPFSRQEKKITHTHTQPDAHLLCSKALLCAPCPPPPGKASPCTLRRSCVCLCHTKHCWYWADSLQAQKDMDLPDRKTKQNRIKQLSFQHTHTHTHTQSKKQCICEGAGDTSTKMSFCYLSISCKQTSFSLSHTHTQTHTHISLSSLL